MTVIRQLLVVLAALFLLVVLTLYAPDPLNKMFGGPGDVVIGIPSLPTSTSPVQWFGTPYPLAEPGDILTEAELLMLATSPDTLVLPTVTPTSNR